MPASAPPLAPSFAPYSSAAPKLLSGKISSASANASSAAPGTKWGRSAATTPTAAGPPPSRYSTLVPPNARGRGAVPSSSAGPKGATGKGRGAVWGQVPQPASGQPASHPRGGRFGSSTDGDFPSVAEAARSEPLRCIVHLDTDGLHGQARN